MMLSKIWETSRMCLKELQGQDEGEPRLGVASSQEVKLRTWRALLSCQPSLGVS